MGGGDGITLVFDHNETFRIETFYSNPEGFVHNRYVTTAHKCVAILCMQGEERYTFHNLRPKVPIDANDWTGEYVYGSRIYLYVNAGTVRASHRIAAGAEGGGGGDGGGVEDGTLDGRVLEALEAFKSCAGEEKKYIRNWK